MRRVTAPWSARANKQREPQARPLAPRRWAPFQQIRAISFSQVSRSSPPCVSAKLTPASAELLSERASVVAFDYHATAAPRASRGLINAAVRGRTPRCSLPQFAGARVTWRRCTNEGEHTCPGQRDVRGLEATPCTRRLGGRGRLRPRSARPMRKIRSRAPSTTPLHCRPRHEVPCTNSPSRQCAHRPRKRPWQ